MDSDARSSAVVLSEGHTVIGAPVVSQNGALILDEIAVVALAVSANLTEFCRLVTNRERRELVHVRIYRELVLVERINAPC